MAHKLSEYIKFDEITLIQVLGSVEDERTFNNLTYMKTSTKLSNNRPCCVCLHV
jgi:hypothetical protein